MTLSRGCSYASLVTLSLFALTSVAYSSSSFSPLTFDLHETTSQVHKTLQLSSSTYPTSPFSIESFGAVADIDTHAQALTNGAAFVRACAAANSASDATKRGVIIPANKVYSFLPTVGSINDLADMTIFLEGTLNVSTANFSTSFPGWPNPYAVLSFNNVTRVNFISQTGQGLVNGRGNDWWWYTILVADHRNNLLTINSGIDFVMQGITFLNAPQYHVNLRDMVRCTVDDVTVLVDIEDQLNIMRYVSGVSHMEDSAVDVLRAAGKGLMTEPALTTTTSSTEKTMMTSSSSSSSSTRAEILQAIISSSGTKPNILERNPSWFDPSWALTPPVPMIWALNTDGIDVSGVNISVTNCQVTNFDDSVCAKPMGSGDSNYGSSCTSQLFIANATITWGVGVSMGSVPPDVGGNCISGVVAHNVTFNSPLKAIYIKPNPEKFGQNATGTIANVLYENVTINDPVWWSIWTGTQQQQQPGSAGTGCSFLFPLLNSTCPSDPQVTVANITLRNIQVYNSLLSPGVLMMNASNPGTNFVWDGVVFHNASTWPITEGYICENIQGVAMGGTSPVPPCFVGA